MKHIDRLLQTWRIRKALPFIPPGAKVIDVGAHKGELFLALGNNLETGFGIEPLIHKTIFHEQFRIEPGFFPTVIPDSNNWDCIVMLAVLEHIKVTEHEALCSSCYNLLRKGGRVIVTVPNKRVDLILALLRAFRLIDGMSLEEHFGFDCSQTTAVFAPERFRCIHKSTFQLGLNNLFVFERE